MIVYVQQAEQQHEPIEKDDERREGGNISGDEYVDMPNEYGELQEVVEATQFMEAWEDGLGLYLHQEFPNKKAVQDLVDRGSFVNCFDFAIVKSDRVRLVLKCRQGSCSWGLRAAKIKGTDLFSVRSYFKMHTCSRTSQSSSKQRRKGTPRLVASLLHDDYPGQMDTPAPKSIMHLVQAKIGVRISYSTALRGKNQAVSDLRGSPEESYKMLYCYLYMLENANPGTITSVKLDEKEKFKYLFIALGCSIEGFQCMRKVIVVDATFLKNGFGGVLVFASAQDPNRHNYPIAFVVLDGENNASWTWFFEKLKSVVPDSSELVFMSDRNVSLISAIGNVYPSSNHGYCVWHLSQNVKGHASNVNKDVVAWRFMECSRFYTVAEFERAYSYFQMRYPSAANYLEHTTEKDKWARCYFPGDRYNLDTSNTVESLNNTFRIARTYSLIPMVDAIVKKICDWFNDHRQEAAAAPVEHKLVPLVENLLHDMWKDAKKLHVDELNNFGLEYNVIGSDGESYLVNLLSKSCICKVFNIEKYPCIHGLAAFITFQSTEDRVRDIQLHELCSRYYWMEQWILAYRRTVYLVPHQSEWNVPDYIKALQIMPPNRLKKKGRKRIKRFPSAGERRPRTQNKRRPRQGLEWLLFGNRHSG